ncbi:MAG TPA: sugar transferase [Candidatus Saccharimonadia bacterium]|nr:sugar transferase [Candidatus Saccharimonadia bacterium]
MRLQLAVKRSIDIIVSGILLLLTLPVALAAAIVVQCYFPGRQIICAEERVGMDSRKLNLFKLRTLPVGYPVDPRNITIKIPRLVAIARALAIDEIPQLLQVVLGSMSLIGPSRPLLREEAAVRYGDKAGEVQKKRPGFVSEYGLSLHLHPAPAPWAFDPEATDQALRYCQDWSLAADCRILWTAARLAPRILVMALLRAGKARIHA